ncbi:MAG: hypothetical protein EOM19_04075 [Candidatus Moranbacteria bacterium]|nr:hypothetical protein [Candidatus Moranbacteria bacterium]
MSEKIKKEDRAFLYFRENAKGFLNVKFGPDQYATDTKKFVQILFAGNMSCITFLSNLTKEEPMETRMRQYENLKLNYHAVLDGAFEDVFEEKKKMLEEEITAIRRAEAGDPISPEFEEKIQEAKKEIKKRSTQKTQEKTDIKKEEFKKNVENKIEHLEKTMKTFKEENEENHDILEEKDFERNEYIQTITNLISDEIEKLKKLYLDIEENKAIML